MTKEEVEKNTILRCLVGSGTHGVNIEGFDDRDEMGICLENPDTTVGLNNFDQYQFRTQPEGVRSGPGDLDLVIYSARKWMRLALKGNPSILLPLFVPKENLINVTEEGTSLRLNADRIISKEAGKAFLGYLKAQKDRLLGLRGGAHTNRPELIEKYGYDTKYAMHMIRLGLQGVELLETGNITLPVPEPHRTWLKELRVGNHTKDEAVKWCNDLESKLFRLLDTSWIPSRPDYKWAEDWLVKTHLEWWKQYGKI